MYLRVIEPDDAFLFLDLFSQTLDLLLQISVAMDELRATISMVLGQLLVL